MKQCPDTNNIPKKELLKKITTLFAEYNLAKVMDFMENDVCWTLVGYKPVHGKDSFEKCLAEMSDNKVGELYIDNILTDGYSAAVNGKMHMENGDVFGFSDYYLFSLNGGSKIKSITSYVIQINKKD